MFYITRFILIDAVISDLHYMLFNVRQVNFEFTLVKLTIYSFKNK